MTTSYHHHPSPSSSLLLDVMLLKSSLRRQRFRRPSSSSSGKLPSFLLTSSTTTPSSSFAKKHGLSSVTKPSNNSIHNDIDLFMDSIHNNNNNTNYIDQNPAQGKRQRRQAAATLVQNFPSWTGVGKKSKAQPRPQVQIPPRGIGPVTDPNQNDVLCGRGGRINSHEGNVQFRDIVNDTKKDYLAKSTKKLEKAHIAAGVVQQIRNMEPSGRFLKEDGDSGMWYDIGDAKAIKKVGQALREDAPDIREEDGEEGGDKKGAAAAAKSPRSDNKSVSSGGRNVIVLPTTRSSRRGEDNSAGALPPQMQLLQLQQQQQLQQQMNGGNSVGSYQQVLPVGSGASITQVSLPSMGPPSQSGMMSSNGSNNGGGSNSAATLRHGQFSLRGQGAMSAKAMEMMNMNQAQQMQNNMLQQNGNGVFGRAFIPPSEMSMGSHGSSVSGLSGLTNSQLMEAGTLLSGLSDGVSSLTAGDSSYRMQLASAVASGQRFHGLNQHQLAALQAMNNQQQQAAAVNAVVGNNNMNNVNNNMNNANNLNANNTVSNNMNANNMNVGMFQQQQRNANMGSNGSVFSGSRGSNGFNNYTLTSGSGASDLSGQTMPQAAAIFGRTSSHNDLSSLMRVADDTSMTSHSLVGGGIRNSDGSFRQMNTIHQQSQEQHLLMQQQQQQRAQQLQANQQQQQQHQQQQQRDKQQQNDMSHMDGMDSSFMSGNSFASRPRGFPSHKDGMDFSVFSGASLANSVANRSRKPAAATYQPASARYGGDRSVAGRSLASNYSIGAMSQSIASMSIHSGGASVASFSAHSMMSDFSDTLLALDLAETSSKR